MRSHIHCISAVLQSCPWMGPIWIAETILIILSPHRFRTARQLSAYSGLAIVMRSSGDWVKTRRTANVPRPAEREASVATTTDVSRTSSREPQRRSMSPSGECSCPSVPRGSSTAEPPPRRGATIRERAVKVAACRWSASASHSAHGRISRPRRTESRLVAGCGDRFRLVLTGEDLLLGQRVEVARAEASDRIVDRL